MTVNQWQPNIDADDLSAKLNEALFPVDLHPVYTKLVIEDTTLFGPTSRTVEVHCDGYQAVVARDRNEVLATVSSGYELITNKRALALGTEAFRVMFGATALKSMDVYNVLLSSRRTICHIDYIYSKGHFEPWPGDHWLPFMRITNSYNRTKKLSFDLGFCRNICRNGVIFEKNALSFTTAHNKGAGERSIRFVGQNPTLDQLIAAFTETLHHLKRFYIPAQFALPLTLKVFDIRPSMSTTNAGTLTRHIKLREEVERLTAAYVSEMGPSGYAMINILTAFAASGHGLAGGADSMTDSYQRAVGRWIEDFAKDLNKQSFTIEAYVAEFLPLAAYLNALTPGQKPAGGNGKGQ